MLPPRSLPRLRPLSLPLDGTQSAADGSSRAGIPRRTVLQTVAASALALPALVRAQGAPVRVGYAIARTGPWTGGAQVSQEPNFLLWAEQQNAAGGLNVKKGEANVTLSIVNARTTEEEALTEGYARKTDVSWGAGGGGGNFWGTFGAAGGGGYQNTEIGQVIVLAYLDAYTKLVTQLGGMPDNAAAAAPRAQ